MKDTKKNEDNELHATAAEAIEDEKVEAPKYTDTELEQISAIVQRLFRAKQDRDTIHPEFNKRNFIEHYQENERIANTFVQGKKFDGDVEIASGTVEQKMYAVLSEINRLALTPEVISYDQDNNEVVSLGQAMTDVLRVTADQDDDEEQKLARQMELLKQGHVFIEESWSKEYKYEKKFDKKSIGKIKMPQWRAKIKKVFDGPRRKILYGPGVYLGNIRTAGPTREQPFIFTHKISSYADVSSRFGGKDSKGEPVWDRWDNVPKHRINGINSENISTQAGAAATSNGYTNGQMTDIVNNAWGLSDIQEGMVEEIHYQDRANDEYQIFLNGVAMLPVGFPLSAISPNGEYTVEKQILQMINPFFAYGRSFVMKVREQSDILDELLRLLIIKTRKSIHPPYANMGHRVISSKVLMPGRITMGLDANALQPIGNESQGATASEYQMFKLLQDKIDENTVSRQFTGMQGKSGTTAFEVATLQKQAEKLLSLTIFACTMLEMKLGYQRLFNCLENYFNPVDTTFDASRQMLTAKYRTTSRKTALGAKGDGIRQVIPTNDMPLPGAIATQEKMSGGGGLARSKSGLPPMKRLYLNPEILRKAKITWYIDIDTQPRETSNAKKLLFREELADIMALIQLGAKPNVGELEQQHAVVWNRQKDKTFISQDPASRNAGIAAQAQAEGSEQNPQMKMPGGPGTAAAPNEAALAATG